MVNFVSACCITSILSTSNGSSTVVFTPGSKNLISAIELNTFIRIKCSCILNVLRNAGQICKGRSDLNVGNCRYTTLFIRSDLSNFRSRTIRASRTNSRENCLESYITSAIESNSCSRYITSDGEVARRSKLRSCISNTSTIGDFYVARAAPTIYRASISSDVDLSLVTSFRECLYVIIFNDIINVARKLSRRNETIWTKGSNTTSNCELIGNVNFNCFSNCTRYFRRSGKREGLSSRAIIFRAVDGELLGYLRSCISKGCMISISSMICFRCMVCISGMICFCSMISSVRDIRKIVPSSSAIAEFEFMGIGFNTYFASTTSPAARTGLAEVQAEARS